MADYKNQPFTKGETILSEGDVPHCAYILKSGSVEIIKQRSDGGEAVLSVLKPGDIFGEMSMVDAEPRSASVKAIEDGELIVVDAPTFRQKQEALDIFSRKLVTTLIDRLRKQNQQLADMSDPSALMVAAKKGQIAAGRSEHTNVLIQDDYRDKLDFGSIRLLLGEGNRQSRQGIKGGLHMQGFREIEDVSTMRDLNTRCMEEDFDLLIVDCDLDVSHVANLIDNIRHGKTAINPYCVVFGVINQPDPKTLDILSNAGLDDVLVKPITIGNIIDRVERRIRRRKEFVVTLDYIGPDRRRNPRPGCEEIPLVNVPNPLAYKALQSIDAASYQTLTKEADAYIARLKIERHAVQIDWLRGKIETLMASKDDPGFFCKKLIIVTKALHLKLEQASRQDHLNLCEEIITKMTTFQSALPPTDETDWQAFAEMTRKLKTDLGPKS